MNTTVKMAISFDPMTEVTITGERIPVLRTVALCAGLESQGDVEVRSSTHNSEVVVDASQSEDCTRFLAEIVPTLIPPTPSPKSPKPPMYTDVQYAMLHTLARAYGHGWACEHDMPSAPAVDGTPWTAAFISECYAAIGKRDGWEPWQYGIPFPGAYTGGGGTICHVTATGRLQWQVADDGTICHVTATGRLQWQVADDGTVGLVICRPGETYLESGETESAARAGRDVAYSRRSVVVLSARVGGGTVVAIRTPETRDHQIPDVYSASWSPDGGPRAEARHGDAMLEALSALVGVVAATQAIDAAGVLRTDPGTMTLLMPVHQADGSVVRLPATVHTAPGVR
jgi:hypothetical protein